MVSLVLPLRFPLVGRLIAPGYSNKQIAAELRLTLRAIEDRRSRLMRRLGVRSVAELLKLVQHGNE